MIAVPVALLDLAAVWLWQAGLIFLRVGTMMSLLPAFGERSVPVRVKLVLAFAFTAIVLPALPVLPPPPGLLELARVVGVEALIGLCLGLGLRLFVITLQVAGAIAAHATSLSQIMGGAVPEPSPAMSYVLVVSGLALAAMLGLHVRIAALIIYSYELLPFGLLPAAADASNWGISRIGAAFGLAFTLAAPFVIASTIYNLALGAINRAMPQLMVAFVGAPVITLGGLVLLCLGAPLMLGVWMEALSGFLNDAGVSGR